MVGTVVHLKKKQARINNQNGMLVVNYRGVEKTALTSFLVTVCHFLLYVPTMLVIGLRSVSGLLLELNAEIFLKRTAFLALGVNSF